jgi:hypothetical protein
VDVAGSLPAEAEKKALTRGHVMAKEKLIY